MALNATAMFNHSNIHIPIAVDRVLRLFVVTPDMHRVHHSVIIRETNSNYGFSLPWWDRLLGTYKDQPDKGHTEMVIGLSQFRDPQKLSLLRLLILPFVGDPGRVPINRRKVRRAYADKVQMITQDEAERLGDQVFILDESGCVTNFLAENTCACFLPPENQKEKEAS